MDTNIFPPIALSVFDTTRIRIGSCNQMCGDSGTQWQLPSFWYRHPQRRSPISPPHSRLNPPLRCATAIAPTNPDRSIAPKCASCRSSSRAGGLFRAARRIRPQARLLHRPQLQDRVRPTARKKLSFKRPLRPRRRIHLRSSLDNGISSTAFPIEAIGICDRPPWSIFPMNVR